MMRRAAALCICGILLVLSNLPRATATSWDEEPAALHWTTGAEGPCAVTLTPAGPCGQGQDTCSYWVHLPPLSVQLPKHLRDLDDIVKEIQRLKDTVDQLRKSCGDCTVNPEERGEEAREQERGKDNHPQQSCARASERDNENENRGRKRGEEKNVKRERGKEGSEEERVIKGVYNSRHTAQTVNRRTFGEMNAPAGSKEDEVREKTVDKEKDRRKEEESIQERIHREDKGKQKDMRSDDDKDREEMGTKGNSGDLWSDQNEMQKEEKPSGERVWEGDEARSRGDRTDTHTLPHSQEKEEGRERNYDKTKLDEVTGRTEEEYTTTTSEGEAERKTERDTPWLDHDFPSLLSTIHPLDITEGLEEPTVHHSLPGPSIPRSTSNTRPASMPSTPETRTPRSRLVTKSTPETRTPRSGLVTKSTPETRTPRSRLVTKSTPETRTPRSGLVTQSTPVTRTHRSRLVTKSTPETRTPRSRLVTKSTPETTTPRSGLVTQSTPVARTPRSGLVTQSTPVTRTHRSRLVTKSTPETRTPRSRLVTKSTPETTTPRSGLVTQSTPVARTPRSGLVTQSTPVTRTPRSRLVTKSTPATRTPRSRLVTKSTHETRTPISGLVTQRTPDTRTPRSGLVTQSIPETTTPRSGLMTERTPETSTPRSGLVTERTPGHVTERTPGTMTPRSGLVTQRTPETRTPRSGLQTQRTPETRTPRSGLQTQRTPETTTPKSGLVAQGPGRGHRPGSRFTSLPSDSGGTSKPKPGLRIQTTIEEGTIPDSDVDFKATDGSFVTTSAASSMTISGQQKANPRPGSTAASTLKPQVSSYYTIGSSFVDSSHNLSTILGSKTTTLNPSTTTVKTLLKLKPGQKAKVYQKPKHQPKPKPGPKKNISSDNKKAKLTLPEEEIDRQRRKPAPTDLDSNTLSNSGKNSSVNTKPVLGKKPTSHPKLKRPSKNITIQQINLRTNFTSNQRPKSDSILLAKKNNSDIDQINNKKPENDQKSKPNQNPKLSRGSQHHENNSKSPPPKNKPGSDLAPDIGKDISPGLDAKPDPIPLSTNKSIHDSKTNGQLPITEPNHQILVDAKHTHSLSPISHNNNTDHVTDQPNPKSNPKGKTSSDKNSKERLPHRPRTRARNKPNHKIPGSLKPRPAVKLNSHVTGVYSDKVKKRQPTVLVGVDLSQGNMEVSTEMMRISTRSAGTSTSHYIQGVSFPTGKTVSDFKSKTTTQSTTSPRLVELNYIPGDNVPLITSTAPTPTARSDPTAQLDMSAYSSTEPAIPSSSSGSATILTPSPGHTNPGSPTIPTLSLVHINPWFKTTPSTEDANSGSATTPILEDTNPKSKTTLSPGHTNSGSGTILISSSGHTNPRSKTTPNQEDASIGPAVITNSGHTNPGAAIITTPSPEQNNPGNSYHGHSNPVHTNPGDSYPGHSNSGVSNPGHTNPGDTNPGHTNPDHSNPHHTNPGDTNPGHSNPGHTNPGETKPGHINLGHRNPGHTNPDHSNPGDTNPGHSNPGNTYPGHSNPGDTNPGNSNPGDSNPGHNNPGDSNPGHSNPGDSNPGHTTPSSTYPGDTNPGHSNPGHSNPGETNPGHSNPGDTNPGHSNSGHSNPVQINPGQSNPGHSNPGHSNPGHINPGHSNPGHSNPGPSTAIPGHTHPLPLTTLTPSPGHTNPGLPTQPTTPSTRELRVKINQVVAFPNASLGHQHVNPQNELMETTPPKFSLKVTQGGKKPHSTDGRYPIFPSSKLGLPKAPRDCSDHLRRGNTTSGIHPVTPDPRYRSFPVRCDMESQGGGWTVIQRRQDGSVSFNRTWAEYREGFGEMNGGEFWLGNEKINFLTRARDMVLRVELEDFDGVREYAEYGHFRVASERQRYRLTVGGYSGSAGDALRFSKSYDHHNRAFTTPDRDHDRYPSGNCGMYYSSGWWFDSCLAANLNGKYYVGRYKGVRDGIFWGTWHNISAEYYLTNDRQSFKRVTMMIRPKVFTL